MRKFEDFKFRIYYTETGMMATDLNLLDVAFCLDSKKIHIIYAAVEDGFNNDRYKIMQQTPWKDMNDEIIHEGDMIEYNNCLFLVTYNKDYAKFKIRCIRKQDIDNVDDGSDLVALFFRKQRLKIVGNICENSELIEINLNIGG